VPSCDVLRLLMTMAQDLASVASPEMPSTADPEVNVTYYNSLSMISAKILAIFLVQYNRDFDTCFNYLHNRKDVTILSTLL
jgi:hypothetical protein